MSQLHKLSANQQLVHDSSARFRVLAAGRRFGKTYLALYEMLEFACAAENRTVWYIGPTYDSAKRTVWRRLKQMARAVTNSKPLESDLTINLPNGSSITLLGADRPQSLRGPGLHFVVFDEAAYLKEVLWKEVIRAALTDTNGRVLFISTPNGHNHFHDRFEQAKVTPGWQAYHFNTSDGGIVPLHEIEASARELDEKSFRQEFEASFCASAQDRVYYSFDRLLHVKSCQYDPIHPLVWSLDFNVSPFCSIVAQIVGDNVYVLKELVTRHQGSTVAACDQFQGYLARLQRYGARTVHVYGDASGNQRHTSSDSTDWYLVRDFFKRNVGDLAPRYHIVSTNPPVRDRVNCVNARLQNAIGDVRLFIDPQCTELIKDLERVSWNSDGDIDKSDQARTHLTDALGYFLHQAFPLRLPAGFRSDGRII